MDWTWQTEKTISECPEIQQGAFSCALCFKLKFSKPHSIILNKWPECCEKKMNILPVGERTPGVKNHYGHNKLYITSLSRT